MTLAAVFLAGTAPALAQPPDRSAPPALGPVPTFTLPALQQRTLSNGLPVWIVELHKVPVVQVDLIVMAGAGADPSARPGLASMTAAMLDEGAGSRSALEIADAVDHLGATLRTGSSFDASTVGLWVPVARLVEALAIMADVALRPTFPEAELERLRKERLTAMLQARDDPRSILQIAFPRLVFGTGHRYGTAASGTPEAVKALATADLRGFHTVHYRPSNAALVVVGDVTPDTALPVLEAAFGTWREARPQPPALPVPEAPQLKARQVYLIDKPGAAQSQIAIGGVGVARSSPDYFRLEVLNTILGGSFTSRLNQNLREQHGYTYGAGSSFAMRKAAGPFLASSGVQTEVTAAAVTEFFNELNAILKPVPADELAKAKNYLALAYPGGFETVGDIAGRIEEMLVYGLPPDYFNTYIQRIQQVSAADLQKAAAQYIVADRFIVVIVGDRQKIEASIRALKLGPVTVLSIEQALGPAVPVQ
jgi:predicted Zn-dependent peptidase